jgi:hypothetical protein
VTPEGWRHAMSSRSGLFAMPRCIETPSCGLAAARTDIRRDQEIVTDQGLVVLGIPIPSSTPLFLGILAVHVVAGFTCTVAGLVAMVAPKGAGRHPSAGAIYYWSLLVVFLSMAALSILRWPHDTHLFVLGILAFRPERLADWRDAGAGVAGCRRT